MKANRIEYLFYLISLHNDYVPARELAQEAGLSLRTVSSCIPEVRSYAEKNGCHLITTKSRGFRLEITDNARYSDCITQLEILYHYTGRKVIDEDFFSDQLLTALINGERYSSVNDIADALYMSRSKAMATLRQAAGMVGTFHLSLDNSDGFFALHGRECDQRMLMVSMFTENIRPFPWLDISNLGVIRNALLDNLVRYQIRMQDTVTRSMSYYIRLSQIRHDSSHTVSFEETEKQEIQSTEEYRCALDIYRACCPVLAEDEMEVTALALTLLISQDFYRHSSEVLYPFIYQQQQQFIERCVEMLQSRNFPVSNIENFREYLSIATTALIMHLHFRASTFSNTNEVRIQNHVVNSHMSMDIADSICSLAFERPRYSEIINISKYLDVLLKNIHYVNHPLRVAVCSRSGYFVASSIKNVIREHFPNFIQSIEACELYELRYLKPEELDCVIMHFSDVLYRYPWDRVNINYPLSRSDLNAVHRFLLTKAIDFEGIIDRTGLRDYMFCHYDASITDSDDFIDMVARRWKRSDDCEQPIREVLHNTLWRSVAYETAVVVIPRQYVSHPFIEYYQLPKVRKNARSHASHVFLLAADPCNDNMVTKFFSDVTASLFLDREKKIGGNLHDYIIRIVVGRLQHYRLY